MTISGAAGYSHSHSIAPDPLLSLPPLPASILQDDREVAKLLTVLNEDLDEEDLQTVLLECLKDAPAEDGTDEKGQQPKPSMMRRVFCLPSGKKVVAMPEEIKLAAKYIVDRFGVHVEAEELGEDGEVRGMAGLVKVRALLCVP